MPATKTRPRPEDVQVVLQAPLLYPTAAVPGGAPARVILNGTPYLLQAHGECYECGFRLVNLATGDAYDLNTEDRREAGCDCKDAIYRERRCKHSYALEHLRAGGAV